MVPKAVADAGYTAVGLGVLALQQVQTQRRVAARLVKGVRSAVGQGCLRLVGIVRRGR